MMEQWSPDDIREDLLHTHARTTIEWLKGYSIAERKKFWVEVTSNLLFPLILPGSYLIPRNHTLPRFYSKSLRKRLL